MQKYDSANVTIVIRGEEYKVEDFPKTPIKTLMEAEATFRCGSDSFNMLSDIVRDPTRKLSEVPIEIKGVAYEVVSFDVETGETEFREIYNE